MNGWPATGYCTRYTLKWPQLIMWSIVLIHCPWTQWSLWALVSTLKFTYQPLRKLISSAATCWDTQRHPASFTWLCPTVQVLPFGGVMWHDRVLYPQGQLLCIYSQVFRRRSRHLETQIQFMNSAAKFHWDLNYKMWFLESPG